MDTIKEFLKPELIWFLIGIVLLVMEFVMPGLIVAFFGFGACVVALVCLLTDISLNAQLIIFIGSSVLSLLCLRKWLKGIFLGHTSSKQNLKEDIREFVGQKVVVIEKIVPNLGGKVEFHGTNWQAEAHEEIAAGAVVEIIGKDNLTLKVKSL
ncbi:MAG: NfeD family protein [Planctomycetota bacterium]|jgi:membrane protein implicated in regulation of membrane protease activity